MTILAGTLLIVLSLWLASRLMAHLGGYLNWGVLPALVLATFVAAIVLRVAILDGVGRTIPTGAQQVVDRVQGLVSDLGDGGQHPARVRIVPEGAVQQHPLSRHDGLS